MNKHAAIATHVHTSQTGVAIVCLETLGSLQEARMLVCAFHLFVRAHEGLFAS